jgi:ATP-dependent DNA helicase RecG
VEERPRIEGALPVVLGGSFAAVAGLLRKPSRLRGTRFKETPEYPEFAWREAILNAVAHRDYGNQGRSTEVSLFDDHMEVASPGGLLPEIRVDALRARQRVHQSRNPRIVRALVDLGFMRDQGEGIPRLFAEMEGLFLPEPELESTESTFRVTLRNTPTLTAADGAFITSLGSEDLGDLEFRALIEASRHGSVDNARMRQIAGLDTLGASRLLRGLRDRGLLVLHAVGASSYYELPARFQSAPGSAPRGAAPEAGELPVESGGAPAGWGGAPEEIGGGSGLDGGELSPEDRRLIEGLGKKPRVEKLREVLARLLSRRWWTPREIATVLQRDPASLVEDHLGPMTREGLLERRYADASHPEQAYRAADGPLFTKNPGGAP